MLSPALAVLARLVGALPACECCEAPGTRTVTRTDRADTYTFCDHHHMSDREWGPAGMPLCGPWYPIGYEDALREALALVGGAAAAESFEQAWERMKARGYQYDVRFGWELAKGEEDRDGKR